MKFRLATQADNPLLTEMHHSQGLDYRLPDLNDRSLIVKLIAENGDGPVYAALLRLTAEAYLLGLPTAGTPQERWELICAGNQLLKDEAMASGLDDMSCLIPPKIERAFGPRLETLGWKKAIWPCWSQQLGA